MDEKTDHPPHESMPDFPPELPEISEIMPEMMGEMAQDGQTQDVDGVKLPYNIEAEAAFLGALLIDNRVAEDVQIKLRAEHFFEAFRQVQSTDAVLKAEPELGPMKAAFWRRLECGKGRCRGLASTSDNSPGDRHCTTRARSGSGNATG